MKVARRRELVSADNPTLPIARQCALLGISRSSFYYAPVGDSEINLSLMRLIDEQFLETPFYGSRQMTRHLGRLGHRVGRHHVRRLMRRMGLRRCINGRGPACRIRSTLFSLTFCMG